MSPKRPTADEATRIRAVLGVVIGVAEREAGKLARAKKPDVGAAIELANKLGPLLGQLRRHDEALANAADKLSPAAVIAYLRGLAPAKRDAILAELGEDDEDENPNRSPLG